MLLCFGLVPFFTGRTTLAIGLVLTWFSMQGAMAEGELSFKAVVIGVVGGVVSSLLQLGVSKLRSWLEEVAQAYRRFMERTDVWLAVFVAMAFAGKMMNTALPETNERAASLGGREAGLMLGVGALAYVFARLRSEISSLFAELPLSDVPGVSRTVFGVELVSTVLGVAIAFAAPVISVGLMGLTLVLLAGGALVLSRVRRGAREACAACGASLHLCASACGKCGATHQARKTGFLGRPGSAPVDDVNRHRLALLAALRCPSCAEPLRNAAAGSCERCRAALFRDDTEFTAFLRHVDTRFAVMSPLFIALGLVPVLGLGLALLTYKLSPAGSLAGFTDWRGKVGARVLRGLTLTGLALVQPVPLIGAGATWAFITASHVWVRRSVKRS